MCAWISAASAYILVSRENTVLPPNRDTMVTLCDVARQGSVSTATVSRVVQGQDPVREATRARARRAIDELCYVPDGAAQSLSRRRKDIIGLVCVEREAKQYDIENECLLYYDEVLRGVQACIRDSEWALLSTFMQADGAAQPEFSRLNPLSGKVDGMLIGEEFVTSRYTERFAARLPVVVIAGTHPRRACGQRGHGRQPPRFSRRHHPPHRRPRQAAPVPRRRAAELIRPHSAAARPRPRAARAPALSAHWLRAGDLQRQQRRGGSERAPRRAPRAAAGRGGERACARLLDRIAYPSIRPTVELLPTELILRSSCGCPPGPETRRAVRTLKPAHVNS